MLSSPKEVKRRFSVTDTIAPEMKREKEKILYIRDMIEREREEGKSKEGRNGGRERKRKKYIGLKRKQLKERRE